MRLKLDENLSRHLKPALADLGHDVLPAGDEGLLSRADTEVAAESFKEGRMLFTLDVEFADLRKYPPGEHPGIILFRPPLFGPLSVNRKNRSVLMGQAPLKGSTAYFSLHNSV